MANEARSRKTPSKDVDAEVGRRIHMLMWDQHITQTELAQQTGIESSGLSKKLKGRGWALAEIVAVADALNVTVASLFPEDGTLSPTPVPDVNSPQTTIR